MLVHAGIAFTFNIIFWGLILLVEEVESFEGWIPAKKHGPKPFRYFEDWYTSTWGDLLGISLLDAAFGYSFSFIDTLYLLPCAFIAFCFVLVFHVRAMHKLHRPDAGYPKSGIISYGGAVHLLYFFMQASICIYVVGLVMSSFLVGLPLAFALSGGLIYLFTFMLDLKSGAFDLLPSTRRK